MFPPHISQLLIRSFIQRQFFNFQISCHFVLYPPVRLYYIHYIKLYRQPGNILLYKYYKLIFIFLSSYYLYLFSPISLLVFYIIIQYSFFFVNKIIFWTICYLFQVIQGNFIILLILQELFFKDHLLKTKFFK